MADGGKECMVDLFMKSLDRWLFIYASSSLKTGKNLTTRPITPYGAPSVAAKSSTFFSLSPPLVCYSRLLTVAR